MRQIKQFFKNFKWNSIAQEIIVGLVVAFIVYFFIQIIGNKPIVAISNEKIVALKEGEKILQTELAQTKNELKKLKLFNKITQLRQTIKKKDKEVKTLKESLSLLNTDYALKVKEIVHTQGEKAALSYLQNLPKKPEDQLKQTMKKWADKYRLEAQLLIIDDQYTEAKQAYEKMIDYDNSVDNLFIYAEFLQTQNFFKEAIINYQKALEIYQTLAKTNPNVYQPDVATILNNLALLYSEQNQNTQAEKAYDEALEIFRTLAKTNPDVYQPNVATTLNNLAVLYSKKNQNTQAKKAYDESLEIYQTLAKTNPNAYQLDVAGTLNNLAVLYSDQNQNTQAKKAFDESLEIYQTLAKINPDVYQPDIAGTLNNLAILYSDQNQNTQAEKAHDEALEIYRTLAKTNPDVYGIDLANTLIMGVYLLNAPKSNLDEAQRFLERFEPTVHIKGLLESIKQLRQPPSSLKQ